MNKKLKSRLMFLSAFILLFAVEALIAIYIHDDFVRPYVGDMIVTAVVWCFARIVFPDRFRLMSLYVMIFAILVEIGQYFHYTELLGITNPILVTMMGTSFAWADIACYAVGCIITAVIDYILFRSKA
ncbi:MAG: DUF2809 domain-containing protein [Clostridia bacterium]|nr:DUF2809 domain-containing protein [Clostridia bacterium]MBR3835833.1 DUF2809 domain-containing protein [Clostridia bacterium]